VVQLVGYCDDAVLTEYHESGTLGDFIQNDEKYEKMDLFDRMKMVIRYVDILQFLHNSPAGTRTGTTLEHNILRHVT